MHHQSDELTGLSKKDLERISMEVDTVSIITGGDMEIAGTERVPTERAMLAKRLLESLDQGLT